MPIQLQFQNKRYYWEAIKKHRRIVALLIAATFTFPLFVFTALPPVEVVEEVPEEVVVPTEIPTVVVINETVVVNTTIQVNTSEGGSFYLEPQPPPPLIDSDIVLCIDVSGSMAGTRIQMTKNAIYDFLDVLNRSAINGLTQDRVSLVTYSGNYPWDSDWYNDANVEVNLDYIENDTHLELLRSKTDELIAGGWTDIWAGLNFSLDILLKNQRDTPALKFILILADGEHNTGPWGYDVDVNDNYDGFLKLLPNESLHYTDAREYGPNSANPILEARAYDIKIFSIGMLTTSFQEEFLQQFSENPENGTGGKYFDGDDTFNLTEAFIRARDEASGWTPVKLNNTKILNTGATQITTFNVTKDVRRLKWDINWENELIDFNLSISHPNGTIISIINKTQENIVPFIDYQPKTVYLDFPTQGIWHFNISWSNIQTEELIFSRLSSYEPPIFINSVTQLNDTAGNDISPLISKSTYNVIKNFQEDEYFKSQSVVFKLNVTNKNPLFTFHNITPTLLTDLTVFSENVSYYWDPSVTTQLEPGVFVSFLLNLTLNEPMLIDGAMQLKINCSEGYYDAYSQPLYLDYRINTRNITETSVGYELRNQTTFIQGTSRYLEYTYNRQLFDTAKWIGLIITFALLMTFLVFYIQSQQAHLKELAFKFRSRLFPDQTTLELALQREGITLEPSDMDTVMAEAGDLDHLGSAIYNITGKQLSPEELIRVASGTDATRIAQRISLVTGITIDEALAQLRDARSIDELINQLKLDSERFLEIIARDEDVLDFQNRIKGLIKPQYVVSKSVISSSDEIDIDKFRSRLKKALHPK